MSFKITPEDVGRKFKFRCGMEGQVTNFRKGEAQPVSVIDADGRKSSHGFDGSFYSDLKESKWDIIAWADEPATDQVANQYRPKDLRDEFAMVAMGAIITTMPHTPKQDGIIQKGETLADVIARSAYAYADAMMKARAK